MPICIYVNSVEGKYDIKLNGLNWFSNKFNGNVGFPLSISLIHRLNAMLALLMELVLDQFGTRNIHSQSTHTHIHIYVNKSSKIILHIEQSLCLRPLQDWLQFISLHLFISIFIFNLIHFGWWKVFVSRRPKMCPENFNATLKMFCEISFPTAKYVDWWLGLVWWWWWCSENAVLSLSFCHSSYLDATTPTLKMTHIFQALRFIYVVVKLKCVYTNLVSELLPIYVLDVAVDANAEVYLLLLLLHTSLKRLIRVSLCQCTAVIFPMQTR